MERENRKSKLITKREFLKLSISIGGGIIASPCLAAKFYISNSSEKSRVILIRNENATTDNKINPIAVKNMLDESIKVLTGKLTVKDAWLNLFPRLAEKDIIGIKVNTAMGNAIPSQPNLVRAITSNLIELGIPPNNIIIFDMWKRDLTRAGYKYNTSSKGVRCIANEEKGWGYDAQHVVVAGGEKIALSKILQQCDHLINVPVLKIHRDPFGVTLCLKNHFGNLEKPNLFHSNFIEGCSALNDHPMIKEKQRVNIVDALYGFWGSIMSAFVKDFIYNGIMLSRDPVAADYIGTQILNEERANHNQPPRVVPLLAKAAEIGLGTNDPNKIDFQLLEI